ncbi:MAG TPA: PilZ domain-containing protein [Candidatus Dormibacteraeota bacterium]|nr:PilZ domain-containing protein [Candidatus Dormibacteraeota bacterium]
MPNNSANERRRAQRFSFIAATDVIDGASGAKFSVRTSDLSRIGCYIDMLNPFPVGATIIVRIVKENDSFEAAARVIYQVPGLGMGVTFTKFSASSQAVLERWLTDQSG